MKRLLTVFLLVFFIGAVNAEISAPRKFNSMPEGTFRKTKNGKIIQYNSKGKKIGTYKYADGRYVKVK